MVAINVYAIMRDAKIWDYPNDFRPERFLDSSKQKDGMEYIPLALLTSYAILLFQFIQRN